MSMKTHQISNNTYAIFSKEEKGGVWTLHFIWGKKDFRLYLGRNPGERHEDGHGPVLYSEASGEVVINQLQYLNAFEWYEYDRVSGHGLANEEVCWRRGNIRRYVELPQNFFDTAVDLACREFGLEKR